MKWLRIYKNYKKKIYIVAYLVILRESGEFVSKAYLQSINNQNR